MLYISTAMDEIDDMVWNDSEEVRNIRSVRKMKAVTVTFETVTLIGKGG